MFLRPLHILVLASFVLATARETLPQNLIPDGSFESGSVPCVQGALPPSWFQASSVTPGADTYSPGCTMGGGLAPPAFGHFGALNRARHGVRFCAGWTNQSNPEPFGTMLVAPLVPGASYSLSGYFAVGAQHTGNTGYDVYLSPTTTSAGGMQVGTIGAGASAGAWTPSSLAFLAPMGSVHLILVPNAAANNYIAVDDLWLGPTKMASCTSRNGTGVNPSEYSCSTRPIIGAQWTTDYMATANTLAVLMIVGFSPATGPLFQEGEWLVALAPPPLFVGSASSTLTLHVPADHALVGGMIATQGARVENAPSGPRLVLLNALDLVLGF